MPDKAHRWTDARLGQVERDMLKIYSSTKGKANALVENRLGEIDSIARDAGNDAEQVVRFYLIGLGIAASLARELAEIAVETDIAAIDMANMTVADVCDRNMSYMGRELSAILKLSVSVVALPIVPYAVVDRDKDSSWNVRRMLAALLSASTEGGIVDSVKSHVSTVIDMDMRSAKRAARTAVTRAEAVGRLEAMRAASRLGANVEKQWVAVMDSRTRKSHAYLDGQHVPLDKPFVTEGGIELMYPADPDCHEPSEVYNCRCTIKPWSVDNA